ncbi:MAG: HTH domain-containing protein [Anaerohalosphaera sp.]|nr:HTH domain-containing protein [Anaerohalosphaera sp.]
MTKLRPEDLVKYFQEIEKEKSWASIGIRLDSYIFPEYLSAEFIARKFGVSEVTALRRLKELEADGVLASKKTNVTGKPGKRFVFFPIDEAKLLRDQSQKEHERPYPQYGVRELMYENYSRKYELMENGDAIMTMDISIRNISNKDIEKITMPKLIFDTYDIPNAYDSIQKVEVDGKMLPYYSDDLMFYKQSIKGQVGEGQEIQYDDFYSEIVYIIPLDKTLKPDDTTRIKLVTRIPKCFLNLLNIEFAGMEILEFMTQISTCIIAPKGYNIHNLKRNDGKIFKKGVEITDIMTEMRKEDLEEKMPKPQVTHNTIRWALEKPVIGYRYSIPFMVTKIEDNG